MCKLFFGGWGSGRGVGLGGVRKDRNEELKLRENSKKNYFFFMGGVRGEGSGGGQGRCEQRSEVFVKIKKKWGGGRVGGGGVGLVGVRVGVNEELKFL